MLGHPTWGTLQGQAGCPPRRVHGHPVGTAAPTTTLSCPWRGADTSSTPRCVVNTQVLQCNGRGEAHTNRPHSATRGKQKVTQ